MCRPSLLLLFGILVAAYDACRICPINNQFCFHSSHISHSQDRVQSIDREGHRRSNQDAADVFKVHNLGSSLGSRWSFHCSKSCHSRAIIAITQHGSNYLVRTYDSNHTMFLAIPKSSVRLSDTCRIRNVNHVTIPQRQTVKPLPTQRQTTKPLPTQRQTTKPLPTQRQTTKPLPTQRQTTKPLPTQRQTTKPLPTQRQTHPPTKGTTKLPAVTDYPLKNCSKVETITDLAHNQILQHPRLICPDGQHGISENSLVQLCSAPVPSKWKQGFKVVENCSKIPKYTAVASFRSNTYTRHNLAGVLIDCEHNEIKIATENCSSVFGVLHINSHGRVPHIDNPEHFYTVWW